MDTLAIRRLIIDHLTNSLETIHRDGFVVGLSGGIDSTLTAHLAVEAVGPDRVLGVVMPERESSPESRELALDLVQTLGIRHCEVDVTAQLVALEAYEKRDAVVRKYFPEYDLANHRVGMSIKQDLIGSLLPALHYLIVIDATGNRICYVRLDPADYSAMVAAANFKQRIRALQLYYHADKSNFAVLGTTNRDESILGFFVKLGDGAADVEAIDILYKSEVFAFATAIGVDQRVVDRVPTTDTLPGQPSQEGYFYGLDFGTLDVALSALEGVEPVANAVAQTNLSEEQLQRLVHNLRRRNETTRILRTPALSMGRSALVDML